MLKYILVASDLSSRSEPAVQRAVQLANWSGSELCVLHVVEGDLLEARMRSEINDATDYLSMQVEGFGKPGSCEIAVATGHAFHVISDEAKSRRADLIVMGAHRRQFLRDVFVGTTIERVTRAAGRPILMAHSPVGERWQKVFLATDMSEASVHAARTAWALGLLDGAEVTFIHVYAPIARQLMIHAGLTPERVHAEAERELASTQEKFSRFIQRLEIGDLHYRASIIEGSGAGAIVGLVGLARPDLLVVGTRGLSGMKRILLGSVAQELMSTLDIDVLAVA